MLKYLFVVLFSTVLYCQNTNPTSVIVGIQHQGPTIGGNISIPLHRFGIASSGLHIDAVIQNKTVQNYDNTATQEPIYEAYSLGYYVDYGITFVSFGYTYKKETVFEPFIRQGIASSYLEYTKKETPTSGAYVKLGIHRKYLGGFIGYSTNAKLSYGILVFIPFN